MKKLKTPLNKTLIVTAGPTREWIDPVRYISNASSGKMGVYLALAGCDLFKEVVLVHGPIEKKVLSLISDKNVKKIFAETTANMKESVLDNLCEDSVLIMAAAPSDYRPLAKFQDKMKKHNANINLKLVKNPDILKEVAKLKKKENFNKVFVCGFAAETNDVISYGKGKLVDKDLDMICINDVTREGAGFNKDTNIITVIKRDFSSIHFDIEEKRALAGKIIDIIINDIGGDYDT